MEERKLEPQLRFPGFEGEWSETKLEEVSSYFSYGLNLAAKEFDGENKYIRITDIDEDSHLFRPNPLTSPDGILDDSFKLIEGDIVFARTGASVGKTYLYNPLDGKLYYAGFLIKAFIDKANPFFVYLQTLTEEYKKWVKKMSMRSGQPGINAEEYKSLIIKLSPTLEEQQKIASFLTTVDKRITLLTQKKEKLEQYKKGVMQKIFNREIRFKDENGDDFPEWEEKRLGDVAELSSSKRVYLSDYVDSGIPFYRGKEISELKRGITPKDILYITQEAYIDFKNKYGVPQINDILITAVGTLGNVYRVRNNKPFYFKDGNLIWLFNVKTDSCFLEILLEYKKTDIEKSSIGSTQKALTMVELRKIKFFFPQSIIEQQKIASFLSAIDKQIENVGKQIDSMKTWKKGLLQQMFV